MRSSERAALAVSCPETQVNLPTTPELKRPMCHVLAVSVSALRPLQRC
ncbi:MAG: hypothetical protein GX025_07505 [Clostridiales bacterium]|nr:hypothetical protein [Clostridiales bacterium]